MQLALIKGDNFRSLKRVEIEPHARVNLITGQNAAGKTSLLETIYCLGRAKSFRGNGAAELAGPEGRYWSVSGRLKLHLDEPATGLGVRWDQAGTQIKLGQNAKATAIELVSVIPVQILDPGMHRLLQDGPAYRRSFLDWGVFHVEQRFMPTWRRHHRALKQRNRALRSGATVKEVRIWNPELAESADQLQQYRTEHLRALKPLLAPLVTLFFGDDDWHIDLQPGWSPESALLETLDRQIERDRRAGTTVEGAHRAELRIRLRNHQVKNHISRGQQKLLIAAMLLAQAQLVHQQRGYAPILLIDDFAAELAKEYQALFVNMLQAYAGQLFITSFELLPALSSFTSAAMFHVEHGQVRQC
ncbi:MAG: DNA replication/repair protein RecF [Nevskiaceae bacterium]|nr:MAG: DNA replication/repair protein RecF [Nevskiaceae bacterium]